MPELGDALSVTAARSTGNPLASVGLGTPSF